MGASIRVREGVPADAEAMARVNAAGWREGYRGILPDERRESPPVAQWRREMREGLRSPRGDSFTRIAELDGEFAGYCFVSAPGREESDGSKVAELVAVYVEPELWGRGAGGALLRSALDEVAALGYGRLLLWTFAGNDRAIRFYERHGFAADGAERRLVGTGTPTLRMSRSLSGGGASQ